MDRMIRKEQTEMNSLDFFFYSLVSFQVKVLKKDLDNSRWSGALVTSFFLCCFVFGVFTGGSVFYRNRLADWFVESATPLDDVCDCDGRFGRMAVFRFRFL